MLRVNWLIACAVVLLMTGCASNGPGEAPAGPGATSRADLSPWLKDAETVTFTGRLQYFHCTSDTTETFWTWSIDPAGTEDAAEVDVRAVPADAQRLENRRVTITGRLIYREPRHFPILVAQSIEPAEPVPSVVTNEMKLAALDREIDLLLGM